MNKMKGIIGMACAYAGISLAELARRMGWSPQMLNARLMREKLSYEEWQRLGEALGAETHISIVFPDGKVVE